MTFREMVVADYQEYVKLVGPTKWPSDLLSALKVHERFPLFLENVVGQIHEADRRLRKRGKFIRRQTIKECVYSITEHFIHNVKMAKEKELASDATKALDVKKQKKFDTFEEITDELADKDHAIITEETMEKLSDV